MIIKIILALFIPPVAVLIDDGLGSKFWINLILSLIFFVPGVIHALLVIFKKI